MGKGSEWIVELVGYRLTVDETNLGQSKVS